MADLREITTRENAHEWIVQNDFLHHGYRKNFNSARLVFRTLFIRHNELMNVWTHIFGALFFLLLLLYVCLNFSDTKELYFQLKHDLKLINITRSVDAAYEKAWVLLKRGLRELQFSSKVVQQVGGAEALKAFVRDFSAQFANASRLNDLAGEHEEMPGVFRNLTRVFFEKIASAVSANGTAGRSEMDFYLRHVYTGDLETYPVLVFLLSALFCLLCSAVYHLFCEMNEQISTRLRNFDYAGVSILISGSSFAVFYYMLYCRKGLLIFYSTCIFSFSLLVFAVSLSEFIHRPENARKKSLMYAGLGLLNVFPALHVFYLSAHAAPGSGDLPFNAGLGLLALSGLTYLLGLFVYTHRFPERYYPLTFDIWMNSHVIWHLCVVAAATLHFAAVMVLYRLRAVNPC